MRYFGPIKEVGFSFVELLVVVAIIGILALIATPYYGDYIERQRWVGAAEAVYSQMQQAKRLAISNNKPVYFIAASDADPSNWCLSYSEKTSSGCADGFVVSSSANPSVSILGENYPGITLAAQSGDWPVKIGFLMPGLGVSSADTMFIDSRLGTISVVASTGMNVSICSDDYRRYDCN